MNDANDNEREHPRDEKRKSRAWAYLLPEMGRTVIRRPITLSFPKAPLDLPEGFRGRVVIVEPEGCRGCGLCARDCPAEALVLEREGRDTFRLIYHPDRCAYCGQCGESCPSGLLRLINEFTPPTFDRSDLDEVLVDRHPEEDAESEAS